ncbi:MAG TPA: PEP-CTERM sorting domain-containing protein [Terriglobales bacterium]|nr:PEP-CTERM sorting domain-containing protein [Terriglobales bacterium]
MKRLIVIASLLLTAVSAYGATVDIVFTSFQYNQWQLGYPYTATVNGVAGVWVMCDDWEHGGSPGQEWQANVTDLGTGDLSLLRFNQMPEALTLYQEAGWLLLQTEVTPSTEWTDINFAVWHIFDSSVPLSLNAQYWLGQAQQEAQLEFPGVNFNSVTIYTPLNQYGLGSNGNLDPDAPQELLTIVPEPGSLILLGGGLLTLWRAKRLF